MQILSKLDQMKQARLISFYGDMSSEECLISAIEAETIANSLRPGDIAFSKFIQDRNNLEQLAILQEKAGK